MTTDGTSALTSKERHKVSSRMDYIPAGSGTSVSKPVGLKSMRLDYIPPTKSGEEGKPIESSGSSGSETGGKLYPAAYLIEAANSQSLKELGEFLQEAGFSAKEIKAKWSKKPERAQAVATFMARAANDWQDTPPEGWIEENPSIEVDEEDEDEDDEDEAED